MLHVFYVMKKIYPKITCSSYVPGFYITSTLIKLICLEGARIWLRHCTKSRKVAGSIPDGVIGIFQWHNPSCPTMALVSTQPVTNEYQECFLGGKGGRCVVLTNLPPSCADCLEIWEPQPLRPVIGLRYFNLSWSQLIVYDTIVYDTINF
jgi:hypothetical protein